MGAEAGVAGAGGRVDEGGGPRVGGGVGEVGALGEVRGAVAGWREEEVADGAGSEAGAVDEGFGGEGVVIFAVAGAGAGGGGGGGGVGGEDAVAGVAAVKSLDAGDGGVEGGVAAAVGEGAVQVAHQGVAVDDAGRGALEDARVGFDGGFAVFALLGRDEAGGDADGGGEVVHLDAFFPLRGVLGDDPFLGAAVRDVVFGAEVVQRVPALDAEFGLEAVAAVVEPGVDDLCSAVVCECGPC